MPGEVKLPVGLFRNYELAHWDVSGWTIVPAYNTDTIDAEAYASGDHVWAVGSGPILHYTE